MTGTDRAASSPLGTAYSISSALADWHGMICDRPVQPGSGAAAGRSRADIAFLDTPISRRLGEGTLDLVAFDEDFILLGMRGRFHQDLSYLVAGEGWTRLHFRKAARTLMDFDGVGARELEGPLCQILHQPQGMHDEEWIEGGASLDWITLFLRPRMLVERFKLDSIRLTDPVRRLAGGSDDFLLNNWSLSAAMILAMDQILGNAFTGDLKRVHLEAKATELVCLMSQVLNDRDAEDMPVKLGTRDVEALHEVRRILARNLDARPSLEALSRQVGINRNKLTYGFRHLFDQTISEFCLESRLQESWRLLHETELPVALIAERIGYTQPAAFCTAFRQRFGATPLQARKTQPDFRTNQGPEPDGH
jgi:AraC-like DNA-binding protein